MIRTEHTDVSQSQLQSEQKQTLGFFIVLVLIGTLVLVRMKDCIVELQIVIAPMMTEICYTINSQNYHERIQTSRTE